MIVLPFSMTRSSTSPTFSFLLLYTVVPTSFDDITSAGLTVTYFSLTVAVSAIFIPVSGDEDGAVAGGVGVWARTGAAMQLSASAASTVFLDIDGLP
ncbi:hypothetical protein Maq22A_2p41075 (plasmid) [Methylobacterium aquaticum]|uniref:Uncharacterized protein n=1 Tax=Methylobacterium aquaticum TaxID=270351 RepID=A0A0C6G1W3_9HYPH|nr:hypothetical protein Maq22A_2p41075 [Methylobacterium aquaticum]